MSKPIKPLTYRDSGVDIDEGNKVVEKIKSIASNTSRKGVDVKIGGFAANLDLKATGFIDPIIVAATDGVGTKLLLARELGIHNTIGIDLVAMCVNDIVVQGAEPLMFLDYIATGKLNINSIIDIIKGIAKGCSMAGCSLSGGETAEMPGLYNKNDFDLAGFAIGAVERKKLLNNSKIETGDIVIGIPSSGFHSNGFSLIREVIKQNKINMDEKIFFEKNKTIGEILLTPTKIYVKECLNTMKSNEIKGLAHITGGGLVENIPRVLPADKSVKLNMKKIPFPKLFSWFKSIGNISELEMYKSFNCGIGMTAIVSPENLLSTMKSFEMGGEQPIEIGTVISESDKSKVLFE
ncbi:phosphoribosylformylglycinamidine cyclo-ligase [Alphaproteobacteria bacterium]|nr:phosphoribosylformylglycinamidine cyclo-ligase [Alphaproteobacteria bacterium]